MKTTRLVIDVDLEDDVHRDYVSTIVAMALHAHPDEIRNWRVVLNTEDRSEPVEPFGV